MMHASWSVGHRLASGRTILMDNSVAQYDAFPVGSPTPHRIPTPLVPGRGDHGPLRRLRPPGRAPHRLGPRDGPEGAARTAARPPLPGDLRRTRPATQRTEGPATGRR